MTNTFGKMKEDDKHGRSCVQTMKALRSKALKLRCGRGLDVQQLCYLIFTMGLASICIIRMRNISANPNENIKTSTYFDHVKRLNKSIEDTIWKPMNGFTFTDGEVADIIAAMAKNENLRNGTKYAVDLGANDGSGPSEQLFTELHYPGLLVEGNDKHLSSLKERFPSTEVQKVISFITPRTVAGLLKEADAPSDMHYLKIDMDADDCATLVAILEAGYRPRVLQAEVTYEIPYPYAFGLYPLSK